MGSGKDLLLYDWCPEGRMEFMLSKEGEEDCRQDNAVKEGGKHKDGA